MAKDRIYEPENALEKMFQEKANALRPAAPSEMEGEREDEEWREIMRGQKPFHLPGGAVNDETLEDLPALRAQGIEDRWGVLSPKDKLRVMQDAGPASASLKDEFGMLEESGKGGSMLDMSSYNPEDPEFLEEMEMLLDDGQNKPLRGNPRRRRKPSDLGKEWDRGFDTHIAYLDDKREAFKEYYSISEEELRKMEQEPADEPIDTDQYSQMWKNFRESESMPEFYSGGEYHTPVFGGGNGDATYDGKYVPPWGKHQEGKKSFWLGKKK